MSGLSYGRGAEKTEASQIPQTVKGAAGLVVSLVKQERASQNVETALTWKSWGGFVWVRLGAAGGRWRSAVPSPPPHQSPPARPPARPPHSPPSRATVACRDLDEGGAEEEVVVAAGDEAVAGGTSQTPQRIDWPGPRRISCWQCSTSYQNWRVSGSVSSN
jgi:hypothetical protein